MIWYSVLCYLYIPQFIYSLDAYITIYLWAYSLENH